MDFRCGRSFGVRIGQFACLFFVCLFRLLSLLSISSGRLSWANETNQNETDNVVVVAIVLCRSSSQFIYNGINVHSMFFRLSGFVRQIIEIGKHENPFADACNCIIKFAIEKLDIQKCVRFQFDIIISAASRVSSSSLSSFVNRTRARVWAWDIANWLNCHKERRSSQIIHIHCLPSFQYAFVKKT